MEQPPRGTACRSMQSRDTSRNHPWPSQFPWSNENAGYVSALHLALTLSVAACDTLPWIE